MARRVRASTLENRTARLKMEPRQKPYHFTTIAPGLAVGYRRNKGPASGCCALPMVTAPIGLTPSLLRTITSPLTLDGSHLLEAQDKARVLIRGKDVADDGPATVAEALDVYDATWRRAIARPSMRAASGISSPPSCSPAGCPPDRHGVRRWRDSLLTTRKASTVARACKSLKAALNLAAAHDQRIGNSAVWRHALAGLPNSSAARRVGLPERDVRAIVAAAYAVAAEVGFWVEVAATTGARPSQLAGLDVADLQDDRDDARLLMPTSLKGRERKRIERRPVPRPASLAASCGRPPSAGRSTLHCYPDRWWALAYTDRVQPFARAAARAGLAQVTAYALRHSGIVRALLAGVPTRVTAALHDTCAVIIETDYARYILDHSDSISRAALLDLAVPS